MKMMMWRDSCARGWPISPVAVLVALVPLLLTWKAAGEEPFGTSAFMAPSDVDERLASFEQLAGVSAADELLVRFDYSGAAKLLYRDGGLVILEKVGCKKPDISESAWCFVSKASAVLGLVSPDEELLYAGVHQREGGGYSVRFDQVFDGVPVFESGLIVRIDEAGETVLSISSTVVAGLIQASSGLGQVSEPSLDAVSIVEAELGLKVESFEYEETFYFVDRTNSSLLARPAMAYAIETESTGASRILIDVVTQEILTHISMVHNYASLEIRSNSAAVDHTVIDCPPYTCASPYTCEEGFCTELCSSNQDCDDSPFGNDWICLDDGTYDKFVGFCTDPYVKGEGCEDIAIYASGAWLDLGYEDYYLFGEAMTVLEDLNLWLYDVLNINSWDDDDSPLRVRFWLDHNDRTTASGRFESRDNFMTIYSTSLTNLSDDDYQAWASRYQFFAHEFGHGVYYDPGNHHLSNECAGEIQAQIHGGFFAAQYFDQEWGTYNQSAYLDEVHGLTGPSHRIGYLPYAQRFVFDNAKCKGSSGKNDFTGVLCPDGDECGPWEVCRLNDSQNMECNTWADYNNNREVWLRMIRIWAEGSSTFSENGLSESMGFSFGGAGLDNASAIYSDTIQEGIITSSSSLQDFAYELIANAGQYVSSTRYALGAIGIFTGEYSVHSGVTTDKSVAAAYYSDWTKSSDRNFYAWKEKDSGTIKVRYNDGTGTQVVSWSSANAGTSPTMAIYNNRLHILWADATTNAIKLRYFYPTGGPTGYYDLSDGDLDITTAGDFDAIAFNGFLYLVYRRLTSSTIYISKCQRTTYGCTSSTAYWEELGGDYRKGLGILGVSGMAVASGSDLNGLEGGEENNDYLYVVYGYGHGTSPDHGRIRVSRVTTADSVDGTIQLHSSAPSSRSFFKMAAQMRGSAYPAGNNYIYFVWWGYGTDDVYMSVLQDWDGNDGESDSSNFWFTRPHNTRVSTSKGPTFKKRESPLAATTTEIMFVDGITPRRTSFYGRY